MHNYSSSCPAKRLRYTKSDVSRHAVQQLRDPAHTTASYFSHRFNEISERCYHFATFMAWLLKMMHVCSCLPKLVRNVSFTSKRTRKMGILNKRNEEGIQTSPHCLRCLREPATCACNVNTPTEGKRFSLVRVFGHIMNAHWWTVLATTTTQATLYHFTRAPHTDDWSISI